MGIEDDSVEHQTYNIFVAMNYTMATLIIFKCGLRYDDNGFIVLSTMPQTYV